MEGKLIKGAFFDSLKRSNKDIKSARAESIAAQAKLTYKRKVEDLETELDQLKRDQEDMLDMSPTTTHSLVLASDFKADEWVRKHLEIGIKVRETEIKLEIAKKQYNYLFEGAVNVVGETVTLITQ
jgi:hypothetical protein